MVLTLKSIDLIIVKNWNIIHEIDETNPLNTGKNLILPLPNFHTESLPFVICAGAYSFNIVNVNNGSMDELIKASCTSQNAAFYSQN